MRTPAPWSWKRSLARDTARCWALARGTALCWALAAPLTASAQDALAEAPATTLADKPAASDSKHADRKARELFEQGRALFKDGHYREAWEHFRDAYILSKRPELLYNVGQSADRMRMDREALEAFKLYLARLPKAENRKEVESRIVWLEDRLKREGKAGEQSPTTLDDSTDTPALDLSQTGDAPAQSPETLPDDNSSSSGSDDHGASDSEPHGPDGNDGDDDVPAPPEVPGGQPERSAWYARVALGLGVFADSLSDSTADSLGSVTISGLLGVGYDIHDGVVIGGGISFDWGLSPTAKIANTPRDIDTANLTMVIAFVDYYLAPRVHGWHLLGGLGVGTLALTDKSATLGIEDGTGGGIVLGGGCEWPLDHDWAIGALAKVVLARLTTDTAKHTVFAPSIAATATWY